MQPELASSARAEVTGITAPPLVAGARIRTGTRVFSFPVLLAVSLAACVFLFDSGSIADPDIWWHLRNAELLVHSHSVVYRDVYSFTAAGSPWMNEAWLGELPYYFGWRLFGIRGLYLVMLGQIELILLGVFALAWLTSRNVKAAFAASWLAIWLATVSFGPRTLLSGWICLIAELFLLELFRKGTDRTWWLVPLFILWTNLHGSWLIGMVLFGVFCISGLVTGTWGRVEATRWSPSQLRKLAAVGALSIAGLFLNPYGSRAVFYPFNFAFQQKLNVSHVDEWMSIDFHTLRGKILFLVLATTIVLGLVRKRHWRLDQVLFLLIGFYAALTYSRFLFLAALLITPLLARELDFLPPYDAAIDRPWLNILLIAAIFTGCYYYRPTPDFLWRDTLRDYPVKALPYLEQLHPRGRVFNDFLWGGYLIWHARNIPVFIDSRVDIYEYNGVFADYLDAIGIKNTLAVLDKYEIQYVFFRKESALGYLMLHAPGWQTLYQDETAVLLQRIRAPIAVSASAQ